MIIHHKSTLHQQLLAHSKKFCFSCTVELRISIHLMPTLKKRPLGKGGSLQLSRTIKSMMCPCMPFMAFWSTWVLRMVLQKATVSTPASPLAESDFGISRHSQGWMSSLRGQPCFRTVGGARGEKSGLFDTAVIIRGGSARTIPANSTILTISCSNPFMFSFLVSQLHPQQNRNLQVLYRLFKIRRTFWKQMVLLRQKTHFTSLHHRETTR